MFKCRNNAIVEQINILTMSGTIRLSTEQCFNRNTDI